MPARSKRFVDQIRRAVDASGESRNGLARRIDLDKAVMSRFMSGKGFLSESSLNRLAAALRLRIMVDDAGKAGDEK